MAIPVFRNPDKFQVLPVREYIRKMCPGPSDGLVVEDLDLVPLIYGPLIGRHKNDDGKFMLVEIKHTGFGIKYAQTRLFAMMDRLLRLGDPHGKFYIGFYVLNWDNNANKPIALNGKPCNEDKFKEWITGKTQIDPYDFSKSS